MARNDDTFEFEMIRAQRKRAPTLEGGGSDAAAAGDLPPSSTDGWHVVDASTDSSNDEAATDDDDVDHKTAKKKRKKKSIAAAALVGRQPTAVRLRSLLRRCASSQTMVSVGLVWCAVVALLLIKWLWFYTTVVKPLENSLGKQRSTEAEPIVVAMVLVVPFVVTGLVYYTLTPSTSRLPAMFERLRAWRRRAFGGRYDSVDVAVISMFAIVQVAALAGKLMIDQYNGKIAKSGYLNRGGRALGMNGFYSVLLSIVLVSRQSFVHQFLRLSSERAAQYHVWCGNFGAIALSVHGLVYLYIWTVDGKVAESLVPCFDCEAKRSYKALRNFSGLVAQLMLVAVALMSLERVRRKHFRRFTLVHCLNVLFVVGTCVHYYPAVYWFVSPLLVYVMYRVVSVFSRTRSAVVSARVLGDAIIQLELRRDAVGLGAGRYVPGQYVYLKVDEISKYEWHPFTISSSPLRNPLTLALDIKVQGPFTASLLQLVRNQSLPSVQIDGFYGTQIETSSDMMLVAGGSGMTPFLSVLEHYLHLSEARASQSDLPQRLWIVWTARDGALIDAYLPLLARVRLNANWKARVWLHCTGAIEEDPAPHNSLHKSSASSAHHTPPTPVYVSLAHVFGAVAVGAIAAMLLVLSTGWLSSVWWIKRLSLLSGAVLGALAGGSWTLWRALPRRAGFERVDTSDTPKVSMAAESTAELPSIPSSLVISRTRPDVEAVLREAHAAVRDDSGTQTQDVQVLVCGPHELQQRVVDASASFDSPFMAVDRRSFAL